jgi:hypothetical protein
MKRLLIGLVTVGALSGCGVAATEAHPEPGRERESVAVTHSSPTAAPAPSAVRPTTPSRLRMAGIDSPVVPVDLDGTALVPPSDPTLLGWGGRKAGARHGVTLLVGHTVHTGGGDLDDLEDVAVGTSARVNGVAYEVTSNTVISKAELAERAPRLFGQSGPPRLVIVTCEGYDPATGHYDSNVVLTATPRHSQAG